MKQIILRAITWHVQDNQDQRLSMKGMSCLTNLISLYDKTKNLVNKGKTENFVYLAFSTVPHSLLQEKLASQGLDRFTVFWIVRPKQSL